MRVFTSLLLFTCSKQVCLFVCYDIGWFDIDNDHNTNVYISGLHVDTTDDEFLELMTKCGIIMVDDQGGCG